MMRVWAYWVNYAKLEQMSIDDTVVWEILFTSLAFLIAYYLLYRKFIFSILDPLFFYILSAAFSTVLIVNTVADSKYIIHFLVCELFLFFGFASVQKIVIINQKNIVPRFNFYDLNLLKYTTYLLFGFYVFTNLITLYTKGFALLSADPNSAKVTNFQGGFGIFRKINWGVGSFLSASLLILYLIETRRIYIFMLLSLAFFTALEGSKSSLMRIILVGVLLVNHPYFSGNKLIINQLKKYIPLGFVAMVAVLYTALSTNGADLASTSAAFLQRMLYSADSVLYFYHPQNEYFLTDFNFLDYIHHITNPLLSFFRLATYDEAIGNILVENAMPPGVTMDVIVGPNSPFYIEGQIYFGYYGAFIYSFLIGGLYAYCRQLFFSLAHAPFFLLALGCALCFQSANVLIESTLFITTCFDTCFFVIPFYVMVCFWVNRRLIIRKTVNNKAVRSLFPTF